MMIPEVTPAAKIIQRGKVKKKNRTPMARPAKMIATDAAIFR